MSGYEAFDRMYAYFKEHPDELAYTWTQFQWTFPPPLPFLEFVFHGRDYVAYHDKQPAPPPKTIRVTVTTSKLNVRTGAGTTFEIVGALFLTDVVEVYEIKENGWYKIASGQFAGRYIFAELTKAA